MVERCLNNAGLTTHLPLGGVVGNSVNVQAVGGIVGDVEEGD
jgi:hypothetical protein